MAGYVCNLTFHGLGIPPFPRDPAEQAVWLDPSVYEAVLDDVRQNESVAITFDDGNLSDIEIGLPALVKRGLTATFFVCAGRLGQPGFLSGGQLRALLDAGMQIGSHGFAHRPWRNLNVAVHAEEFRRAKMIIEDATGRPVSKAACPFGSYDRRALAELKMLGFSRVYTSDRGWASRNAWLQPRNTLYRVDCPAVVRQLLAQNGHARQLIRDVKMTLKRWR